MKNSYVQLSDQFDITVTMSAPAAYNPDILEDLKNRMMDAYKEALTAQKEAGVLPSQLIETVEESE